MLSLSQGIPAKWPRHSANRNPLSIKPPWTQKRLTLPHVAFRLNKGNVFPWWAIPEPYSSTLHLSDWSYTVTPTLCTCQEPPERSRDEWGRVKDSDVDVRRAAAWNKEVPQQSQGLKGLVAAGRGSAAAGKEPPQYVHSHANTATGIQKLWLSHYTDKLVLSTLGCHHSD